MSIQGSISTMSVSDLLQFLAVGRKTGLLKFSHQKVLKGIYFENGIIVGSSTNDPREYLGQVLMHYGKIDEAQLQAAMEIQRSEARGQRSENRGQRSEVGGQVEEGSSSEFRGPSKEQRAESEGRRAGDVSGLKSQGSSQTQEQIPDSRFQNKAATQNQIPDSKFQSSEAHRQIPDYRSQISNSRFQNEAATQNQIPDSKFQGSAAQRQIPDYRSQSTDSRSQISDSKFQIPDSGIQNDVQCPDSIPANGHGALAKQSGERKASDFKSQVSSQTQNQIPDSRLQNEVQGPKSKVQSSDAIPANGYREQNQISDSKLPSDSGDEHRLKSMPLQRPRRLGQILVADGILTEAQIAQLLEVRTLDIIYDLFLWKEGHFEFGSEGPLPADFTRVRVEANRVVMEGIHRADEMARYRTLIPSDRTLLELSAGWTSSLPAGKTTRQLLYFLEKRMSVAEICYNMHSSAFEVYAQLYDLVKEGAVHVVGELPEIPDPVSQMPNLPDAAADLLLLARSDLNNREPDKALSLIHTVLGRDPKNTAAHALLLEAEKKFIDAVYAEISPSGVPQVLIPLEQLGNKEIGSQEGFVLSRINGEWDIQSILSICPFREADSLSLIKKLWDGGIIGF